MYTLVLIYTLLGSTSEACVKAALVESDDIYLVPDLPPLICHSASRSRLERFTDKLRDLLQRDAQHLIYKTHVYGELIASLLVPAMGLTRLRPEIYRCLRPDTK